MVDNKDNINHPITETNHSSEKEDFILKLTKKLQDIENEQNSGAPYYSLEELDCALKNIVGE